MSPTFSLSPSDQVIERRLLQRFLKVNPSVSGITARQVPLDCAAAGRQFKNTRNDTPTMADRYLTGNPVVHSRASGALTTGTICYFWRFDKRNQGLSGFLGAFPLKSARTPHGSRCWFSPARASLRGRPTPKFDSQATAATIPLSPSQSLSASNNRCRTRSNPLILRPSCST